MARDAVAPVGDERASLQPLSVDLERAAGNAGPVCESVGPGANPSAGADDGGAEGEKDDANGGYVDVGFGGIFRNFALLGWTAFGGPAAHIGFFQKQFVEQMRWMSAAVFAELLALCQCLPGPSSTQMSFAIGTFKRGVLGGLLSGVLFQYPGLIILTILGYYADDWAGADVLAKYPGLAGFVSGLSAAGVALVATAAINLGNKLCKDTDTKFIAAVACIVSTYYVTGWIFPLLLLLGGLMTYFKRGPLPASSTGDDSKKSGVSYFGVNRYVGGVLVAAWLVVLVVGIALRQATDYADYKELHWFESFYRTGAIIWGGGQVVLPLLQHEVVHYESCCTDDAACLTTYEAGLCSAAVTSSPQCGALPDLVRCTYVDMAKTWVTEDQFFAGLGLAQAMPGPLFNLAAFLGSAVGGVGGAAICWLGLFGPGVMLIFGVLPFWGAFRQNALYKRMLPGLNASAVGLIFAAVISMATNARAASKSPTWSTCVAVLAFYVSHFVKLPAGMWSKIKAPMIVVAGGGVGAIGGALGAY